LNETLSLKFWLKTMKYWSFMLQHACLWAMNQVAYQLNKPISCSLSQCLLSHIIKFLKLISYASQTTLTFLKHALSSSSPLHTSIVGVCLLSPVWMQILKQLFFVSNHVKHWCNWDIFSNTWWVLNFTTNKSNQIQK